MVSVGIIEPDEQMRATIRTLLLNQRSQEFNILFELERANNLLHQKAPSPQLILVELKGYSTRVIKQIKIQFPKTNIIILSEIANIATVLEALRAGAVSYLLKSTCLNNIASALIATHKGGSVISPFISREMVERIHDGKRREDLLSARELQIANGLADGLSYKLVADRYNLAVDTVRVYIKRIYRKLNINSKGELIAQLKY